MSAEHAVKLRSDFLCKIWAQLSILLQVVEKYRTIRPNLWLINFMKTNIKGELRESVIFISHELGVGF